MTATQLYQSHQGGLRSALSVAEELGLPLYRLHSWESLYPVFMTQQRDDGQTYYDAQAVEIVRHIARLLYQEGAKSHEIVARLRQEGIIGRENSVESHDSSRDDVTQPQSVAHSEVAALTEKLTQLEQENKQLGKQLEEFGQIALSLKTLEDENERLKHGQEVARNAEHEHQKDEAYRRELEKNNAALQTTIERLNGELAEQKSQLETQKSEHIAALKALREELKSAHEGYGKLRDNEEKRQKAYEAEARAAQERQTHLETEKHTLVQKLEQSVLLMQALEDENVRLKRSLKEGETVRHEQTRLVERIQALESANRTLKAEHASLQQVLSAQDEQRLAARQKQAGIQQFLHELRDELGQIKRIISE